MGNDEIVLEENKGIFSKRQLKIIEERVYKLGYSVGYFGQNEDDQRVMAQKMRIYTVAEKYGIIIRIKDIYEHGKKEGKKASKGDLSNFLQTDVKDEEEGGMKLARTVKKGSLEIDVPKEKRCQKCKKEPRQMLVEGTWLCDKCISRMVSNISDLAKDMSVDEAVSQTKSRFGRGRTKG